MARQFSNKLLQWHRTVDRYLPWKENNNVFHIWLSEIILQQTRVEQGIPYFLKFRNRFETINDLAEASDEELMRLWQGLGYYSRARNLHKTAKIIAADGGNFPKDYKGLLALPGIGPYTAAAIASFAYDHPHPVIDGNVNRVISRIFGITEGIDTTEGKLAIQEIVNKVFDEKNPGQFNQAIMDFGAMVCVPKNPSCLECPFQQDCLAYQQDMVSAIPFKAKKVKKKERTFNYVIILFKNQILIRKRLKSDIWKHLHDFPELLDFEENITFKSNLPTIVDGPFKHILTHRRLKVYFHVIEAEELILANGVDYFLVERENLRKFAFPKIIDWYLSTKSIY
jgi:A/G-specific adenine glycosylase